MRRLAGKFAQIFNRPPLPPDLQQPRMAQVPEYVELGGKLYPFDKAVRVYEKLTLPKTSGEFYNKNRVRGNIDETGNVTFEVSWPELANAENPEGWSLEPPPKGERVSPRPVAGLTEIPDAFTNWLNQPKKLGTGLFYNVPRTPQLAKRYANFGFTDASTSEYLVQYLDNRRFTNSPTVVELLALGDDVALYPKGAELLRQKLLEKHPQIRDTVEARIARGKNPLQF